MHSIQQVFHKGDLNLKTRCLKRVNCRWNEPVLKAGQSDKELFLWLGSPILSSGHPVLGDPVNVSLMLTHTLLTPTKSHFQPWPDNLLQLACLKHSLQTAYPSLYLAPHKLNQWWHPT